MKIKIGKAEDNDFIVNDPHEKVNLYTVSEYAKVKRELFAAMKELQQKYHDPVVLDLPIK